MLKKLKLMIVIIIIIKQALTIVRIISLINLILNLWKKHCMSKEKN